MITLENVSKRYSKNGAWALKDVSLHIKSGEFVSIVGQSGSGKTTLAKLLFAEESATKGKVIIGDWDITHIRQGERPVLRRQIGVVFQDYKLLPRRTVFENVAFALQVAGAPQKRMREIVPQVLKIVGLSDKAMRYPHQLSGGEQQRVSIARALVHQPKIFVADEPTGNLDTIHSHEIIQLLKRINEYGTTIVLVTHDRDIVNALKKRVITLDDGKMVNDVENGKYSLA